MKTVAVLMIFTSVMWSHGAALAAPAQSARAILLSPDAQVTDLQPVQAISNADYQQDIETLVKTFRNGYGGYKQFASVLEKSIFPSLRNQSAEKFSTERVCLLIGRALDQLADNHLSASNLSNLKVKCGKSPQRKPSVGSNVSAGSDLPWGYTERQVSGVSIPVISMTWMANVSDSRWNGLIEKVQQVKANAKALIIDLRGNPGGSDANAINMATILYGLDQMTNIMPPSRQVRRQSPEAFAVLENAFALRLVMAHAQNKMEERSDRDLYNYLNAQFEKAESGSLPSEVIAESKPFSFQKEKAFTGPIRILIDAGCASSCESGLEAFERFPNVKTVGENTRGFVHFGDVGTLRLKNSNVFVSVPTTSWQFDDKRFVEKTGFAPTIRVQPGHDAMEAALEDLSRSLMP